MAVKIQATFPSRLGPEKHRFDGGFGEVVEHEIPSIPVPEVEGQYSRLLDAFDAGQEVGGEDPIFQAIGDLIDRCGARLVKTCKAPSKGWSRWIDPIGPGLGIGRLRPGEPVTIDEGIASEV